MAKTVDYTELDAAAMEIISSSQKGVLQNDLWKELTISSRDCTRLILRLQEEGLVTRTEDKNKGSRTYRITAVTKTVPKKEIVEPVKETDNTMLLMAGDTIVPCVACTEECNVEECPLLEEWVYELAFSEIK